MDMSLMVSAVRASVGQNAKGYNVITKPGLLVFDFVPTFIDENKFIFNYASKQSFFLEPRKVSELMLINTIDEQSTFTIKYDYIKTAKSFTISRNSEDPSVFFSLTQFDEFRTKELRKDMVTTTLNDLYIIQRFIDYAQPYMMGWDTLATPFVKRNVPK